MGKNKCESRWAKKINEGDLQVRLFLSVPPSPLVKDGGEIIVGIDQCLVLVISFFDGLFAVQVTVVVDSFVDGGGCTKFLFLPCHILIGEWSGEGEERVSDCAARVSCLPEPQADDRNEGNDQWGRQW